MSKISRVSLALLALALITGMTGCRFDNPLSGSSSKDLNSWLLGVWEHKDDKGKVLYRSTVTPKSSGRYWVRIQKPGGGPSKNYLFEAWISRVGRSSFLTLLSVEGPSEMPPGSHAFAHYQVLDQNNVRIRIPQLESPPEASSMQLRKEVRKRLKEESLYPDPGTNWQRVSEVYWSGDDAPQPFQPLRFPTPPQVDGQ